MADVKISQLPASTTPLDGTEVLPIVQSATTKQVSVANLTAGRAVSALSLSLTNALPVSSGGTGLQTTGAGTFLVSATANNVSATATPSLGVASTTSGTLSLYNSGSANAVTIASGNNSGAWTFTLPTSGGTNNYILTTNGSGATQWTNPTALGIDLDVGTTAITGGTTGRVLYDNGGVLGEYSSVPVSFGGTGLNSLTAGYIPYGNGTGAFGNSANLTFDGTTFAVTGSVSTTRAASNYLTLASSTSQDAALKFSTAGNDVYFGQMPTSSGVSNGFSWYIGGIKMSLNSAGALLVGTTSTPSTANARIVAMGSSGDGYIQFANTGGGGGLVGSSSGAGLNFYTYTGAVGSETYSQRAMIDAYGSLLVGTATTPTTTTGLGTISTPGTVQMGSSFLRNRFINGGMDVWQRGTSFPTWTNNTYAADRWYNGGNTSAFTQSTDVPNSQFIYSASIAITGANYATLGQRIESVNCAGLAGNSATITFWYKSTAGTPLLYLVAYYANSTDNWTSQTAIASNSYTVTSNTWTKITYTIDNLPAGVANGINVVFFRENTGSSTTLYTGFQFEAGSIATPFERRQYGTELMLCQRYYQVANGGQIGFARTSSTTICEMIVPFLAVMRASPSIGATAALKLDQPAVANFTQSAASASFGWGSTGCVEVALSNFTGLPASQELVLRSDGGSITLSSEL